MTGTTKPCVLRQVWKWLTGPPQPSVPTQVYLQYRVKVFPALLSFCHSLIIGHDHTYYSDIDMSVLIYEDVLAHKVIRGLFYPGTYFKIRVQSSSHGLV